MSVVVLVSVLALATAWPQSNPAKPAYTPPPLIGDSSTILSLLQQSHELNQPFVLPIRLRFLAGQALMASRLPDGAGDDLARTWADELFRLASQAKEPLRSRNEGTALGGISSRRECEASGASPCKNAARDRLQ